MTGWTLREVMMVNALRRDGAMLATVCERLYYQPAREVQEAWWATINRSPTEALDRLNRTLTRQAMGEQNINMRPAMIGRANGGQYIR